MDDVTGSTGVRDRRWLLRSLDFPVKAYIPAAEVGYSIPESGPYWNWTYNSPGAIASDTRPACSAPAPTTEPAQDPTASPTQVEESPSPV